MSIVGPFDRPIPGQSLTDDPKNNPWEQPPQMAEIEDVTVYYIQKLANQEVIDDFAALCQAGVGLKPIVESITTQGVIRGLHTVDSSMLVAPIIHEFLKQAISSQGIEVKDGDADPQKKAEESEMRRFKLLAMSYLNENPDEEDDPGKEMLSDLVEDEPKEEETPEEKPMGLMAKG